MLARLEIWQLTQLQRLASFDPERVEAILNTVWNQYPGLYCEMAISAVDQQQLSIQEVAERLERSESQVENDLFEFRKRERPAEYAVVHDDLRNTPCVADGRVAVWEVIREFRKLGSVDRLKESFPALSEGELLLAIRYANDHKEEIEAMICDYEMFLDRIRTEYPFAK